MRSNVVSGMPGGVSGLMRRVLNVFYSSSGNNFSRGVSIVHRSSCVVLTATFAGFIADEKAHKEIMAVKGAAGTKPCITCKNAVQFTDADHRPEYYVGIECHDYDSFDYHTIASFYAMVDHLEAAHSEGMSKKDFKSLQ